MTSYKCPFCGEHSPFTDENRAEQTSHFSLKNATCAMLSFTSTIVVCMNSACGKLSLYGSLHAHRHGRWEIKSEVNRWRLIPGSSARALPDYIPKTIAADYTEACLIARLSPKASATLSRRCLQGMIRDFWSVLRVKLSDEIVAIKDKVDSDVWDAIDAVRKIGNIGAHMEADINVIVDVDPDEALQLIGLIELLVDEWYVARENRKNRIAEVIAIGALKAEAKKA